MNSCRLVCLVWASSLCRTAGLRPTPTMTRPFLHRQLEVQPSSTWAAGTRQDRHDRGRGLIANNPKSSCSGVGENPVSIFVVSSTRPPRVCSVKASCARSTARRGGDRQRPIYSELQSFKKRHRGQAAGSPSLGVAASGLLRRLRGHLYRRQPLHPTAASA